MTTQAGHGTGFRVGHEVIKTDTPGFGGVSSDGADSETKETNPGNEAAGSENNGGQKDEFREFWGEVGSDEPSNSSGGSSAADSRNQPQPGTGQQQQPNAAESLRSRLEALKFGDSVLTDSVIEQMNEGNLDGFNANLNKAMQEVVKQTLYMVAPMMQNLQTNMGKEIDSRVNKTVTADKNLSYLHDNFAMAKEPDFAPVLEGVYAQALTRNKGNREQALSTTKRFFKAMSTKMAPDVDLSFAPGTGQGNQSETADQTDWKEFFRN